MADITIPQLNAATSVSVTDVMVISQAGVTKKVEVDKLLSGVRSDLSETTDKLTELGEHISLGTTNSGNIINPSDIIENIINEEFVSVTIDNEGRMVEWVDRNGTKHLNSLESSDIKSPTIDNIYKFFNEIQERQELDNAYIYIIKDEDNNILFTIDKSGNVNWSAGIPEPIKEYIDNQNTWVVPTDTNYGFSGVSKHRLDETVFGIFFNNNTIPYNIDQSFYLQALKDLGIKRICLYYGHGSWMPYESDGHYGTLFVKLNNCIKFCNDNDISVVLYYSSVPNWHNNPSIIGDTVDKEEWIERIKLMTQTYSGNTEVPLTVDGSSKAAVKADYFYVMEEMELSNKSKYGFSVQDLLDMYETIYTTIKREDEYANIINTIINEYHKDFFFDLLNKSSQGGMKFHEMFDLFFIDNYAPEPEDIAVWASNMYKDIIKYQPEILEKTQWNCSGDSSWTYTNNNVGQRLVRRILVGLSCGAESFNYYTALAKQDEKSYWGVLGPSVSNSHIGVFTNDSTHSTVTLGDASKEIIFGFNTSVNKNEIQIPLNLSSIVDNVKNGIVIEGKSLHINTVSIVSGGITTTVYNGNHLLSEDNPLILSGSLFATTKVDDVIKIASNDAVVTNTVKSELDCKPAYFYYKTLAKFLNEGCSRPVVKNVAIGVYVASWLDKLRKPVFCVWAPNGSKVNIEYKGRLFAAYNQFGDSVAAISELRLTNEDLIYIKNVESIKVIRL